MSSAKAICRPVFAIRRFRHASFRLGVATLPAVLLAAATILLGPAPTNRALAQDGSGSASNAEDAGATADQLPLRRIVMFNSGVAFFDRAGQVEGDATVNLRFNVEDINDLLKSMVLQDNDGGQISTINFGSKDPITKTLKTFAIDLTDNPTLGQLLGQIRGEGVTVTAPEQISGTILGVESRKSAVGDQTLDREFLNLLTAAGLKSIPLDSVGSIKLQNADLNAELLKALAVLATGHDVDKKSVSLNFTGTGQRRVNVGYIQEAPIWKTSYRLVLQDERSAYLQGWAIVENTTEEDWDDVRLTLVSGRPISFLMDLYQPLYVPRPIVEPELFASLRPQNYNQDLGRRREEFARLSQSLNRLADKQAAPAESAASDDFARGEPTAGLGGNLGGRGFGRGPAAPPFDPAAGVASVAEASDVGELFQYQIATPVSLPRRQSAMLPIVDGTVSVEKVSIYNPAAQAKHPLNGLRLTNGTELHLMAGPVTVFDDDAYAGDAQIPNLAPGSERLMSYALDLNTEVAPESKSHPQTMTAVKATRGVLFTTYKYLRQTDYTIKNSGEDEKKVLIEYAKDPNWTLVTPEEPAETTRDIYRFAVMASPGVPSELTVKEEHVAVQQVSLNNVNDDFIGIYLRSDVVSDAMKQALSTVIERKQEISDLSTRRATKEREISEISAEQDRIRRNMQQLAQNSDLYRRYVQKFNEQETRIESLRGEIAALRDSINEKQQALNEFISELEVE